MPDREDFDPCPLCGRWMTVQMTPANHDRPFSTLTFFCEACDLTDATEYLPAHPAASAFTSEGDAR